MPYYAGARGVIYRKDLYKAAGITNTPKSLGRVRGRRRQADGEVRRKKNPHYSALYFPGRYWYAAMSFVYDYGGADRPTQERQVGRGADSPQALPGLTG